MNGSKSGWILPIAVIAVLLLTIWLGVSQCNSGINEEDYNKLHDIQLDNSF